MVACLERANGFRGNSCILPELQLRITQSPRHKATSSQRRQQLSPSVPILTLSLAHTYRKSWDPFDETVGHSAPRVPVQMKQKSHKVLLQQSDAMSGVLIDKIRK
jgi:hypothetical protein